MKNYEKITKGQVTSITKTHSFRLARICLVFGSHPSLSDRRCGLGIWREEKKVNRFLSQQSYDQQNCNCIIHSKLFNELFNEFLITSYLASASWLVTLLELLRCCSAQNGRCRSPAARLKMRPQVGHSTLLLIDFFVDAGVLTL